jgi:hypothetical protein
MPWTLDTQWGLLTTTVILCCVECVLETEDSVHLPSSKFPFSYIKLEVETKAEMNGSIS